MNEKDFIFSKSKDLSISGIKSFPIDFIQSKKLNTIEVPDKVLVLGKEFFGSFEVASATVILFSHLIMSSKLNMLFMQARTEKTKLKFHLI